MRAALGLGCVLLLAGSALSAAASSTDAAHSAYQAALAAARQAVAACASRPAACTPSGAPADVLPGSRSAPALRFDWLRDALTDAQKAPAQERARMLQQASSRLDHTVAELGAPIADSPHALAVADTVLRQRQFRFADTRPSWWQLLQARFWAWVDRMLESAATAAQRRPWLGLIAEWGCLAVALSGILVYLLRVLRRDRLRMEMPWHSRGLATGEAATDWLALAEAAAEQQRWREAVHAIYWAAIVQLTEAGNWRAGPARTPREYLRLLEPGSDAARALAALTRVLERAWYANRPATEQEYRGAARLAGELGLSPRSASGAAS